MEDLLIIEYNLGCRSCLSMLEFSSYLKKNLLEELDHKTEFAVSKLVSSSLRKSSTKCINCLSASLEPTHLKINNEPLYDYEEVVEYCKSDERYFLIFIISKENDNIDIKYSGYRKMQSKFIYNALEKLKTEVLNINIGDNISHNNGQLWVSFTGGTNTSTDFNNIVIQRLEYVGIDKFKLLEVIEGLLNDLMDKNEIIYLW